MTESAKPTAGTAGLDTLREVAEACPDSDAAGYCARCHYTVGGCSCAYRHRFRYAVTKPVILQLIAELTELRAASRWNHSSVEKPKPGQFVCFLRGGRGQAGEVAAGGQLYRLDSAYPVADQYDWCALPRPTVWPLPAAPVST